MTHENLTPHEAMPYSVNRNMSENGEGQPPRGQNQRSNRGEGNREAIEESLKQQSGEAVEQADAEQAAATILDRIIEERVARGESEEEARRSIQAELNAQIVEPEETPPTQASAGGAGGEEPPRGPEAPAAGAGGAGDGEGGEPPEGPPGAPTAGTPEEPEGVGDLNTFLSKEYTDPIAQNVANEIKDVISGLQEDETLDLGYLDQQMSYVRNLRDSGQITNGDEVRDLLRTLTNWRQAEIRRRIEERGDRYFDAVERQAILTNAEERERIFEQIYVGVDSNPGVEFRAALSLEASGRLDNFFTTLSGARIFDPETHEDITDLPERRAFVAQEREKLTREFSGRAEIRRILHDANWSVSEGGGDIRGFAGAMATFRSEYLDLIFADPLVGTAMHMFEQAFQQIKAENNGKLPYEQLAWDYKKHSSGLEDRVWRLMREAIRRGVINRDFSEWRLRRAIILARGFGVVSLRFPEIAAQARLPEETPLVSATDRAKRIGSIYGETIARYLDPLEHIIEKFSLGEKDRALLYFFLTGDKSRFQSKEQLKQALDMKSQLRGGDRRLIDMINIFRTGGPFSYSSWRAFVAMEGMEEKDIRASGIGIREIRVRGDIDDEVIEQIRAEDEWKGRSEEEVAEEIERREKTKVIDKEKMRFDRRIEIWKDALKTNPLRVMWMWEERDPGARVRFLSEALNVSEQEAKDLLPQIEQDLMVVQENTAVSLARGEITYDADEMLNYNIIGGATPTPEEFQRRTRVQSYVEKIREKAQANSNKFIRDLYPDLPHGESPFPFIIGMEDIPFSDFNFIKTGGRGFARRINDFAAAVEASNELVNLITSIPKVHNIQPLIESLDKMKQAVSNYDKRLAMQITPFLAEGIIRIYDKEVLARLPLGIGTVIDLFRDTSFAQTVYGREAMTWDEGDKFNFTRHLLLNNILDKDDLAELRKRVGATYVNLGVDLLRTYGQLALLLLAYQFMKTTAESK